MIVGINHLNYPERRAFADLDVPGFEYKRCYDPCKLLDALAYRLTGRSHLRMHNMLVDTGIHGAALFHYWNGIQFGRTPWVSTFESSLPRWLPGSRWGLRQLQSPACHRLIAITDRARRLQENWIGKELPAALKAVMDKVEVMPMAQPSYLDPADLTPPCLPVTFAFVGDHFFRKGGMEILAVLVRLVDEGCPVRLIIVSHLQVCGYMDTHVTPDDVERSVAVIEDLRKSDHIILHRETLGSRIYDALEGAHVGLLPSYGETYGLSILEAQASGCPVITTDIDPLNEMNDNELGWLLEVPVRTNMGARSADLSDATSQARFSSILEDQLYACMKSIIDDPASIVPRSKLALERVRSQHDPAQIAARLGAIYESALAR